MKLLKRAAKPPAEVVTFPGGGSGWPPFPVGFLGQQSLDSWWSFVTTQVWTGDIAVDEQSALGVPAVSASLSLLAAYVTQMPLQAVKEGTTPPVPLEPQPKVCVNPLGDPRATGLTFTDWIDPALRDLALYGNTVAVLDDPQWNGWPNRMFPVGAGLWSVRLERGRRIYTIGDMEYDAAEIFHVAINRRTGELVGRGLMNTNRDTLASAIMAERWAAKYFRTGTVPSVHISHPNPDLTQTQADELKQKFLDSATGNRAPVVTPVGTEITVLPSDAESAQLVESRRWANASLAMALGVQPAMLGLEGPSMTYRNIAEVNQQTINTTVMRYLVPIEQQMSAQLLPAGTRCRFQTGALARPDLGERITQATAALAAGVITVDEARAWLDLPPLPQTPVDTTEPLVASESVDTNETPQLQVIGG